MTFLPKRKSLIAVALLALTGAAVAQESEPTPLPDPAAPQAATEAFDGRYAPVVRNNIFVKDRRPYVPPTTRPAAASSRPAAAPADPAKDYELVGIVFEGGVFRAYFTNLKGGPLVSVAPGGALAEGAVGDVFIDAVRFVAADGREAWVDIGQDLTGGTPAASSSAAAPATTSPAEGQPAAGTTTGATPAPADPSKMSVEERMRLRRQQRGG